MLPGTCGELLSMYIEIMPLTVSTKLFSATTEVPKFK